MMRIKRSFLRLLPVWMTAIILLAGNCYAQEDAQPASEEAAAAPVKTEKVHSFYYKAKLKRTVKVEGGKIKAGKTVTVTGKKGKKSKIIYRKKKYTVASSALRLVDFVTRGSKPYSVASAEAFVNQRGYRSKTSYLIWVSCYTQHVYVLRGRARHWKVAKHFKCATGIFDSPTPRTVSTVTYKRPWSWSHKPSGRGVYYGVRIKGGLIHSWIYNIRWAQSHGGKKRRCGRERYGKPASHGCVRVRLDNAKWLYKHIPLKTTTVVY